jgi:peptide deformylase
MILPIVSYGNAILRTIAKDIEKDYPDLSILISNMFETMYAASGVGLAAPQVGQSIRLFVVDASDFSKDYPEAEGFKKAFINPKIIEESGEPWIFNEGCLSFPTLREDIKRKPVIKIEYYDESFILHSDEYTGVIARVIQHEFDHVNGIVFVDRLTQLKKRLLKRKLSTIANGEVEIKYKMQFANKKKNINLK